IVFFEDVVEGFDPNNITARQVDKFKPASTQMERSALTVHRPVPYITKGTEGLVLASGAFADRTQLTVPSTLNANDSAPSDIKNIPFKMTAVELNDPLQRDRIAQAAIQQLSAICDSTVATEVANRGSIFIKNGGAINAYGHVAQCEEQMSIRDVPIMEPRTLIMNPTDYNAVSGDLANRDAPPSGVSLTAYERSRIPTIATFDSFKANFMPTQALTTAASYLVNGANQDHDPAATDGNGNNVDNRTQSLIIDGGSNAINEGDAFTIAGVYAVSHVHKNVTAELQTFRVTSTASAAGAQTITITPAIVVATGGGGAQANIDYANCSAIPADNAALTFLNLTAAQPSNIFFMNRAVEIVHGSLATMDLNGAGVATTTATTDSGIEILFAKGAEVRGLTTEYRLTMWMNANVLIPDMCGNLIK
ncbi:MAG: hypothetical protein GY938_22540, partial [Ketobacter sp.]|nr:hypothetical protein [Ketobacter sp.]